MPNMKTVLVVDDNEVNRKILSKILSDKYSVLEAENGEAALLLLNRHIDEIVAVMLDIVMPVMDGYAALEAMGKDPRYNNLPILVTTENSDNDNEIKALALGAWDFVSKPYHPQIIHFRLKNAIDRSQLTALKQLKYLADYDALTGIYNKTKFFAATREMIDANKGETFVFLRFDVDRFQLINSFFGTAEGDKLLLYIARHLEMDAKICTKATYGRIESDIVGLCMPYDEAKTEKIVSHAKKTLARYNPNYDIVPSIGMYIVADAAVSVEEMYNRATLAAKTCKGNYVQFYAYYNESMSTELTHEQEIVNDMNYALENRQFEIYLQPQYNIHTNLPCGAEALVRWKHPVKGMIYPNDFIPVFERNGFITKLDYYVWEQVCQYLHNWRKCGNNPYPISVNISRVNVYNPKLADNLIDLVNRYNLEPGMLSLEVTESAYTDNPVAMKKAIKQLQDYGFIIMMDDFGSGYSSLSLLKDISIDILKIDMRFLSKTDIPGRGENIIASVIRMAKWLNIPIIAEGAETVEQVDFLRSVGCDYAQGYYFARPMPVEQYEQLSAQQHFDGSMLGDKKFDHYQYDDLFSLNKDMQALFNNALQAAVIYEFVDDRIDMIRVNEAYYALLGHEDMLTKAPDILSSVDRKFASILLNAFRVCVKNHDTSECEYRRERTSGAPVWINLKLCYVSTVGNKHILIGELTDVTMRKEIDGEMQKYRESLLCGNHDTHTILIVDDAAINRAVLKKILQKKFRFLEAENGEDAISVLQENRNLVDLILLDISMPVMDGKEFLKYKKRNPEFDGIPVIMITADDSPEQQISTLTLGANDYIVKPFIPQVVTQRVTNVLQSNHRFKEMVREYNNMSEQVKIDMMTGLLNRISAEDMIAQRILGAAGTHAMLMMDIDNFKQFNDTRGHAYGDKVIAAVAEKLKSSFRQNDIVARMGGDEFSVFMENIPDAASVKAKTCKLCESMADIKIDGINANVTCSVGIAISGKNANSFETLYKNADKALYDAKCGGRNTVSVFGEQSAEITITKWINDTASVLDAINDSIYACDVDTYELIYANENLCKVMGTTQEQCKGRKCYEMLMSRKEPCTFCHMHEMQENMVYTRMFKMPGGQQVYLLRGKIIKRDGADVHLEVAVDVTKIENMHLYEEAVGNGE